MTCCVKFSKLILFLLDFLFVIIGLIVFAIGVWSTIDQESFFETIAFFSKKPSTIVSLYAHTEFVKIVAIVLIALGAALLIFAFFGCWGVISENTCLLFTYAAIMILIVLWEVACIVLIFALRSQWEPQISAAFSRNYEGALGARKVADYDAFSLTFDGIQVSTKCCGIEGPDDYSSPDKSEAWHDNGRFYITNVTIYQGDDVKLPAACCQYSDTQFFRDQQYTEYETYMNDTSCPLGPVAYNPTGCMEAVENELVKNKVAIIVTLVILVVLQLLYIGLTFFLAVRIQSWEKELYR